MPNCSSPSMPQRSGSACAGAGAGAGARHASRAHAIPEDADADARLLEAIADWCLRYTPLVASIRPTACCSTSAAARISTAARRRCADDLLARMRSSASPLTPPSPARIGAAWAAAHFSTASVACRRRSARHSRPYRSPRCGFRPTPSRRWRASASSASAISWICRAHRSPPASAAISCASSTARSGASTSRSIRACRSRLMSPSSVSPSRSRARRMCWRPSSGWRRG